MFILVFNFDDNQNKLTLFNIHFPALTYEYTLMPSINLRVFKEVCNLTFRALTWYCFYRYMLSLFFKGLFFLQKRLRTTTSTCLISINPLSSPKN